MIHTIICIHHTIIYINDSNFVFFRKIDFSNNFVSLKKIFTNFFKMYLLLFIKYKFMA